MKGNKITEWEYETPTEPGFYMYCYGDVVVPANTGIMQFDGDIVCGEPVDTDGWFFGYVTGYQWARLLIGSDAK